MEKMNSFIKIFVAFVTTFVILPANAQQEPVFSHHMYNMQTVNPGYAGSRGAITGTMLHRSMWISHPGAPNTQTFSVHSPLIRKDLGVGLSIVNDKIGPTQMTSLFGDVSYAVKVNHKGHSLRFGLKVGGSNLNIALADLTIDQQNDQAFQQNVVNRFLPNFGAGLYYDAKIWYMGISSPMMLTNKLNDFSQITASELVTGTQKRHLYYIAGLMIDAGMDLKLKPTILAKITGGSGPQIDASLNAEIVDKIVAGLIYRLNDAAGLLIGMKITEQLLLSYGFDWSLSNKTGTYNYGSHELMLRYDFIYKNKAKVLSPRYF